MFKPNCFASSYNATRSTAMDIQYLSYGSILLPDLPPHVPDLQLHGRPYYNTCLTYVHTGMFSYSYIAN
jgi:hypothetical protein